MESAPQPNSRTQEQAIVDYEKAREISHQILETHKEFIATIKSLRQQNQHLNDAIQQYGAMEAFESGFHFLPYGNIGTSAKFSLFDSEYVLSRMIESNEKSNSDISIEALQNLQNSFVDRLSDIVEGLAQDFQSKEEAYGAVSKICNELIMPPLDHDTIFIEKQS